jgi:hypothetical protein
MDFVSADRHRAPNDGRPRPSLEKLYQVPDRWGERSFEARCT